AEPAAGAKAFLAMYPEAAPRGAGSADAIRSVLQSIARRIRLYQPPYPSAAMGSIKVEEFRQEADMNGLKIADFSPFYTNDLIAEINDFDLA
ncbi:hypothetical protein ABTM28_20230, partial [Acinetobacter baumannii]